MVWFATAPPVRADRGVTGKGTACLVRLGAGDCFMFVFPKWKTFCEGEQLAVQTSPHGPCRAGSREHTARRVGKRWGLGGLVWPTRPGSAASFSVCLFRNVPGQKPFNLKSPRARDHANHARPGWGFHPEELGEAPAQAQMLSGSGGDSDGWEPSLSTQLFCCLGDEAPLARSRPSETRNLSRSWLALSTDACIGSCAVIGPGSPRGCSFESVFAKQMCPDVSHWTESWSLSWKETEVVIVL